METYLTLAIAVGGIATGIGAIWAAIVARRELSEQRTFLQVQTDLSRRQAELSEQNLASQRHALQEQNERARTNLEVDLMYKLGERWESQTFNNYRRDSIKFFLDNFIINGGLREVTDIDAATRMLFDFFDEIGYLTRSGVLRIERVLDKYIYARSIWIGWKIWEPAVKKLRHKGRQPGIWSDFEYLHLQLLEFNRRRGGTGASPTEEDFRLWIEEVQRISAQLQSSVAEKEAATAGEK
jgi:hypothetical protein